MHKILIGIFVAVAMLGCSQDNTPTSASAGMVTIMTPANGAKVAANAPFSVEYAVTPSPQGNHVHIYIDNGKPDVVKTMKGFYSVKALAAGPHTITIKEVTSGHSDTGVEASVQVVAE